MKSQLRLLRYFQWAFYILTFIPSFLPAEGLDGFTYEVEEGATVTITGYTGAGGDLVIPNLIEDNPVTSIGNLAFLDGSNLTTVMIPSSVTSIRGTAFYYCTSLTSISVEAGNIAYASIDGVLCDFSQTTLIQYPIGKTGETYAIPNGVTNIGGSAFYSCVNLKSITIPSSIISVDAGAFSHCANLTSITIPSGVTSVGAGAFGHCTNLTIVTIISRLSSIESSTFSGCTSLSSITIPNSVTSIGNYAFSNCSSLANVTIPNSVTSIGYDAFTYCTSLADVTILGSVTSIDEYAFSYCTSLTSITIPSGSTNIGRAVFANCTSLTNVTIPNTVTSIGSYAFSNCTSLTSITIPSSVTSIGDEAFAFCSNLAATNFLGDDPSLGESVFNEAAANYTVFFLDTSTGFTSPTWYGYPSQMINTSTYPAATWLLEYNIGYDSPLNQDLNGDGVDLLMAYAMDLNPNERLTHRLPVAQLNSDTLSVSYYAGRVGVSYRVESSKNLNTWGTAAVFTSEADAYGVVTDSIALDGMCGFLRLVVTEE